MRKFDKDKYLKKLKFKKIWNGYKRYAYIGFPCLLVVIIGIYFAYSKFSVSKDTEVVRTTVGNFISGDIVIGAYLDGEYSKTVPGKNDGYVVDKIVCDNDASASWDNDSWGIVLTNLTKRTKCNVYFHKDNYAVIIASVDTSGKCPSINADGTVNATSGEATYGYLCSASDAYGTSYYYRGNVTNNYVKFADKYWRIVRINGDGSIRVAYDGTEAHENGNEYGGAQIGSSVFNDGTDDNMYVGYMYGDKNGLALDIDSYWLSYDFTKTYYIAKEYNYDASTNKFILKNPIAVLGRAMDDNYVGYYMISTNASSANDSNNYIYQITDVDADVGYSFELAGYVPGTASKEAAQTNKNDSTIKKYLDDWYKSNILGTENEKYLKDNIFCNDRSFSSNNTGTGAGNSGTSYRWSSFDTTASKSTLKCPQQNDAFTVSDTTHGNGALTYPIGLLTTDEVVLAGGYKSGNSGYYLRSLVPFWTLTPSYFGTGYPEIYKIGYEGNIGTGVASSSYWVRPVLNLSQEVLAQGAGTMDDPYHP